MIPLISASFVILKVFIKNMNWCVSLFFCLCMVTSQAQSTFKMMHYNLLNYGNELFCNELNNNTNEKDDNLRTLIPYVSPDIITVNELSDLPMYADRLLDEVLNVDGTSHWNRAEMTNTASGSGIVNMMFYNQNLFELYDQEMIAYAPNGTTLLRVVDLYHLYEKSSAANQDTTYFTLIVAHYSASSDTQRELMTAAVMDRLEELGDGNYIFSADFNMDSSGEDAFADLLDGDLFSGFNDPVGAFGNWSNNPNFAPFHTQSTRGNTGDCFVGGGMDDRFDLTLVSTPAMSGSDGLEYLDNSYTVVGNDGDNFNDGLHISNNAAVPTNIAIALYSISDHLPVTVEFSVENGNAIEELSTLDFNAYIDGNRQLHVNAQPDQYTMIIYDLQGRVVMQKNMVNSARFSLQNFAPGSYLVQLNSDTKTGSQLIVVE